MLRFGVFSNSVLWSSTDEMRSYAATMTLRSLRFAPWPCAIRSRPIRRVRPRRSRGVLGPQVFVALHHDALVNVWQRVEFVLNFLRVNVLSRGAK